MDHDELARKASQSDPVAIEHLLQRHMPGLRAYLRLKAGRIVRARESHSDLVQSVCREVLQGADGFEYRGEAAFKKWLFTAALRKLVERQRYWLRDKRDAGRDVGVGAASSDDQQLAEVYRSFATPSHNAAVREHLEMVEAAFDELPEHYREVIVLHRILGMSQREVAEELGKTEVAVQRLLTRARVKLSGILRRMGMQSGPE